MENKPSSMKTETEYQFIKTPPETKWNVLNLGAGVQSSCLALMAEMGEIDGPPIDFAVFADTQAEPTEVYEWLNWLDSKVSFPIYRVTNGNLTEDSLEVREISRGENKGKSHVKRIIPAFGILPNGEKTAAIGRSCTADYKVKVIVNKIKELCEIKRGQKEITVTQWIGISWDELQRMKYPSHKFTQHRWPLIERRMTRAMCKKWMVDNGFPEPPRSACYYCPFHSDEEWRRLRDNDPKHFQKAVEFDKQLRKVHRNSNPTMKMEVYIHNSCKPLDEIDFDSDEQKGQQIWDFQSECDGMCGV